MGDSAKRLVIASTNKSGECRVSRIGSGARWRLAHREAQSVKPWRESPAIVDGVELS